MHPRRTLVGVEMLKSFISYHFKFYFCSHKILLLTIIEYNRTTMDSINMNFGELLDAPGSEDLKSII